MKAEGTREEWFEIAKQIEIDTFHGTTITSAIMMEFERRGFITKPEWKQAYDEYVAHTGTSFRQLEYARDAIYAMHDRIVELEKMIEEGE